MNKNAAERGEYTAGNCGEQINDAAGRLGFPGRPPPYTHFNPII